MYNGSITDIAGLTVGHAQDTDGLTGVSVVLLPNGAVCGA
ncbi:MAG TPA: peptidase S58, partial [Clostridiales bacterium]|nr:peptidase S58 [Clostridiales bacterium]